MARIDLLSDTEWVSVVRDRLRADSNWADSDLDFLGVEPASAKGQYSSFVADNLRVRVRVRISGKEEKDVAFFMKTLPTDCEAQVLMARDAFVKEVGLYRDVFPRMRELPPSEKMAPGTTPWAPRTFFTRPDLLLMEDLIEQGFVERDRRNAFDFEHISMALRVLGRFHASSILFEQCSTEGSELTRPFNQQHPELTEELMVVDEPRNQFGRFFPSAVRTLQKVVGLIPKYKSSVMYEDIVSKFPSVQKKMVDFVRPSTKYRNVLNHGDLWSNNILFRYSSDGRPVDVRLLDFQVTRYCPPAVDIMLLLYLTTLPTLRRERGGQLLRLYHASLTDALQRGGVHDQHILPWDELVASCDEYHDVGRIMAPALHHAGLITPKIFKENFSPESFEKFVFEDRSEVVAQCFEEDEYYCQKITDELSELVERVILGQDSEFWKRATTV